MARSFLTRGVLLKSFDANEPLSVEDVALRPLRPNEVLVQIAAAAIHPSDLVFLRNRYGISKKLPVVPGFEGSGLVVEAGRSPAARRLLHRRVACHAPEDGHGTWAHHMIADVAGCTVLRDTISFEEGASLLINPLTAWLLLEEAKKQHAPAFVQTASSSEAGKMLIRLGRRLGLRSVCIVRKDEQKAALKRLGATEVLSSQRADFPARLRTSCRREKVAIAFDAVGGKLTSAVAHALPTGGHVIVYGALAGQPCEFPPASLIFEDKQLRGFWLTARVKNMSLAEKERLTDAVQPRLKDDLATAVLARFELKKINEAIAFYKVNRSDGKVLLTQGESHE